MVQAFDEGLSEAEIHEYTNIDPWFLAQLGGLHATEQWLRGQKLDALGAEDWRQVKRRGFSDPQIATFLGGALSRPCLGCYQSPAARSSVAEAS